MSSLTDLYISDSYTGLLHSGGVPLSITRTTTRTAAAGWHNLL